MMKQSILFIVILALVGFAVAEYRSNEYRTNYGVQDFSRLIDEFSIVSPAKYLRQVRLALEYPGGVSTHH